MELDERTRQGLFQRLDDVLGPEHAEVLMSYLPPVGWADVATKRDLDLLSARFEAMLHREIGALRTEVGGEIGALRTEVGGETKSLRGELGSLRAEIGELRTEFTKQTRGLFFALAGLMVTMSGIMLAAIRTI